MRRPQKLGEILLHLKAIDRVDLNRIVEAMHRTTRRLKFGQAARAMGLITEEQILAALAVQMNLFPGVQCMTLPQILDYLQSGDEPKA